MRRCSAGTDSPLALSPDAGDDATAAPPGTAETSAKLAVSGAAGGVVEAIVVQPLDMVKTRFQLNTGQNTSIVRAIRDVVKEGGVMRLYRGMLPEAIGMVPKSSGMYATYESVRRNLTARNGGETTMAIAASAGTASGLAEAVIVTPFQVVKVRLQAKEHLGRYSSPTDCIAKTMREEGLAGFTRGLGPTCWRNGVWNTVYFGLMFRFKQLLPTPKTHAGELGSTLLAGFGGGMIATGFNAPFDVTKSRFQSQVHVPGQVPKYRFTLPSLAAIVREEGVAAVYKGFAPKAWRMGLGGAVSMAAFEATNKLFNLT